MKFKPLLGLKHHFFKEASKCLIHKIINPKKGYFKLLLIRLGTKIFH